MQTFLLILLATVLAIGGVAWVIRSLRSELSGPWDAQEEGTAAEDRKILREIEQWRNGE